ncbi:uncharacterized protein LOC135828125 [Sycon ciliatum]|uniref:uncharacterized protein LOC135828125 n=1 Tax=Sycon ciliatum TaxID=27933 RepID=UPI0031F6B13D
MNIAALHPNTPINIDALHTELLAHPNPAFVHSLISNLRAGCRIGFTGPRDVSVRSPNLSSAAAHPEVVDQYLATECSRGHTAGPFNAPPFVHLRTSGVGVVPKKSGGHRLIMHLSAPDGNSVNSFIDKQAYRFSLITIDTIADHVRRTGPGALLSKVDLKHAFRLCPVHPDDWPVLGMLWKGNYYFDTVLPFGLRSAPSLFNCLATTLEWILRNNYSIPALEHYLDDFVSVSPAAESVTSSAAATHKATILQVFAKLGVPTADGPDKVVGPATCLTVLGIDIDSAAGELRLPAEKLRTLRQLLAAWATRPSASKHELQSLVGHLAFAAKVVPAGRTFTRRLIDLCSSVTSPAAAVRLTSEALADIKWWQEFLPLWNGKALLRDPVWSKSPDLELFTDASGSGFGGFYQGRWFAGTWSAAQQAPPYTSIMWREMWPIAIACQLWGPHWAQKKILLHCDNSAVCTAWESGTCRHAGVMALIRSTMQLTARHNFCLLVRHIAGVDNSIADALSRAQFQRFRRLVPDAETAPSSLASAQSDNR